MMRVLSVLVFSLYFVCGAISEVPSLAELGLTSHNVTLANGVDYLHMVEKGQGDPVIFIHGWPDSWKTWITTIPYLSSKTGRRYIFVDLRGFGQSTRNFNNFVSFNQDMIQFMDALGITQASFVGHSMGSLISRDLAIDHPSRVSSIILVASALAGGPVGQYIEDAVGVLQMTEIDPIFVDEFQKSTFYNLSAAPEWFVESVVYESTIASLDAWKKGLQYIIDDNRPNSSFTGISAPTLIMRGEFDSLFVLEEQLALHELIPNNKFIIVDNAGHSIQWDLPLDSAVVINNFLAQPCDASGIWTQRLASSWQDSNGLTVSRWDLTLRVGAIPLYSVDFSITPTPGTSLVDVTNAHKVSGNTYRLPEWVFQNGVLSPNSVVNQVSYTLYGNTGATVEFVNDLCLPPADCFATVTPILASSTRWNSSAFNYQHYTLKIVNTGPRSLASVEVEIKPKIGSVIESSYNLVQVAGVDHRYVCSAWNLSPQGSLSSCGFFVKTAGGSQANKYATTTVKQPLCS